MPYEEPTVEIAVELRVRSEDGSGRVEWRRCSAQPPALEYVYTHSDLCSAVRSYAALAAQVVPAGKYSGWRIVVHGVVTRRLLSAYEWAWDARAGAYRPADVPWCSWPAASVLTRQVKLGALQYREREFRPAAVCGSSPTCLAGYGAIAA